MKKIKIIGINIIIIIFIIALIFIFKNNNKYTGELYNGLPIYYSEVLHVHDISTPEKAMGVSKYAFIGKVNKILRTEHLKSKGHTPTTIYEIEVVKNIKGELKTDEPIELEQLGGLAKNKKNYEFASDSPKLLNSNEYYVFMTSVNEESGSIEAFENTRIISLGETFNEKEIVNKYTDILKNQEIPDGFKEQQASRYEVDFNE